MEGNIKQGMVPCGMWGNTEEYSGEYCYKIIPSKLLIKNIFSEKLK